MSDIRSYDPFSSLVFPNSEHALMVVRGSEHKMELSAVGLDPDSCLCCPTIHWPLHSAGAVITCQIMCHQFTQDALTIHTPNMHMCSCHLFNPGDLNSQIWEENQSLNNLVITLRVQPGRRCNGSELWRKESDPANQNEKIKVQKRI